jgi:Tfp pilus assembly protein PilX
MTVKPRRRHLRESNDQGIALVTVMFSMAILSLFLLSSLAYALQGTVPARRDQDAKTAIGAAEAGIDEYISRLNANDNYWQNGNIDSTNAAFTTAGQVIQGTGTSGARYTYSLLTTATQTAANGVIRLQVTGMSSAGTGGTTVSRTLTATLQPKGFLSYVYLSDVEVIDPDLVGDPAACANYYYNTATTSARSSSGCSEIQWTGGDTVQGPLHSNDALQINGAVNFTSVKTETSCPAAAPTPAPPSPNSCPGPKSWWGSQNPPLSGFSPKYAPSIALPTSNNTLLANVEPDVDGDSSTPVGPGCYYTGATRIILQGTTMKVLSPSTTRSDIPSRCYNRSTPTVEQTVTIPPVIYVDSTSSGCTLGAVGYPATNEKYTAGSSTAPSWGTSTNYACSRGSAYVEGNADTQVTIAAKDDVVVTGDITLTSPTGTDVVGLIAGNYAWVYHPIRSGTNNNLLATTDNVNNIQVAILALRHSFVVQNWGTGAPLGTLNVLGSISQKFRGPVGTGSGSSISTGYYKNYVYDTRLAYLQPPYFLKATDSPWQVATVTDK